MIKGFDAAVANMKAGEIVDVHLMPSEAYGEADPRAIFTVEKTVTFDANHEMAGKELNFRIELVDPVSWQGISDQERRFRVVQVHIKVL